MRAKKIGVIALSAILAIGGFAGCKKEEVADDDKTLQIYAKEAGYGVEWLHKAADAFMDKYPEYEVIVDSEIGVDRAADMLTAGPEHTTEDLLFVGQLLKLINSGENGLAGYDNVAENLTDMYEMEVPGEGVSLKEKMLPDILDAIKFDAQEMPDGTWEDQYYTYPYQNGLMGIVYNKTVFEENNLTLPRTTEELYDICDVLQKDITPLIGSLAVSYMGSIGDMWWAQYEGVQEYKRYWNPTSADDYDTMRQKGKLYMLHAQNQLNKQSYGRLNRDSIDAGYTESQAKFINREAAMLYCGGWFENEMAMIIEESRKNGNKDEYGMMMTPLNSAIVDRLSFWATDYAGMDYAELIEKGRADVNPDASKLAILKEADLKLRQIIDYVDGVSTEKPAFATDNDIAIVRGSRNLMIAYGAGSQAVIPSYATAKEAAKKFLLFLATDEMQRMVAQTCAGSVMPFKYNPIDDPAVTLTSFAKNVNEITYKATLLPHTDLMKGGWLLGLPSAGGAKTFAAENLKDYKTPQAFYEASIMPESEYIQTLRTNGII